MLEMNKIFQPEIPSKLGIRADDSGRKRLHRFLPYIAKATLHKITTLKSEHSFQKVEDLGDVASKVRLRWPWYS